MDEASANFELLSQSFSLELAEGSENGENVEIIQLTQEEISAILMEDMDDESTKKSEKNHVESADAADQIDVEINQEVNLQDDENAAEKEPKMDEEVILDYVHNQRNVNTNKKTNMVIKRFQQYLLDERHVNKPIIELEPVELNVNIGLFLMFLKKKDGGEMEPDTLTNYHRAIARNESTNMNIGGDIEFDVVISDTRRSYCAGDHVTGHVFVNFPEALKIRGIDLRFLGQASVQWVEKTRSENDSRRIITKVHKNKETYFDTTLLLFGRADDEEGEDIYHPLGTRRYSFDFQFPRDIPSSFEGSHGEVTYVITGLIDIPWAPDRTFRKKLKINTPLDLNSVEKAKDGLIVNSTKTICCLCCKHGPIDVEFGIVKAGYVPGENILLNAHIVNRSRRRIAQIEVLLKRYVVYRASSHKLKLDPKVLRTRVDDSGIPKGGEFTWKDEPLLIPKCPPSFLPNCGIIDIRYELAFAVDIVGTAMDVDLNLELIFGTIPLEGQAQLETLEAMSAEDNRNNTALFPTSSSKQDPDEKESQGETGQSNIDNTADSPTSTTSPISTQQIEVKKESSGMSDNTSVTRPLSSQSSLPEPSS